MHAEYVLFGQDVVHHAEYALFDLAGVLAAADHDQLALETDQDGGLAVDAVDLGDAMQAGDGNDGKVGGIAFKLLLRRTQQHLMDEHILAGHLIDDAETLAVGRIGAGKAVKHKHIAALQIGAGFAVDGIKFFRADRNINLPPGDFVVDGRFINNEAIFGAAAGIFAGLHNERAGF
ncbi:hypothetical protein SDC9_142814 [bioreactor metagenome]|uniref:Uncharacterized protein n=1 Tax=bioreactor metagenome TaxID=1076179 RepID=A0A645E285_9ZZZZ